MTLAHRATPGLRLEVASGGRLLLRQRGQVVLLARGDLHHYGIHVFRTDKYVSPLPPLQANHARRLSAHTATTTLAGRWIHQFATWLDESDTGPLHTGTWILRAPALPPYGLRGDLVRDHPAAYLDWFGDGWNGVIPLRRLPHEDAGRVKAYRKQATDGTLPPLLLWWVSGFDGWLLIDGHDRLVAARAEGIEPPLLELALAASRDEQQATLEQVTAWYEEGMAQIARQIAAGRPGASRAADQLVRRFGAWCAQAPGDTGRTRAWPIRGGAPAWTLAVGVEAPGWSAELVAPDYE